MKKDYCIISTETGKHGKKIDAGENCFDLQFNDSSKFKERRIKARNSHFVRRCLTVLHKTDAFPFEQISSFY